MDEERAAPPLHQVLWKKLTEPHPTITARDARYESRVLASLLIMIFCLILFAWVGRALLAEPVDSLSFALVGISICYGLSRTPRYKLAAGIAIAVMFSVPNLVAFRGTFEPAISSIFLLEWPILGVLIAYFMFGWRLVIATLLLTVIGTSLIPLMYAVDVGRYLFTTLNILFIFSVIMAVFSLIRSDNQKERAIAQAAEHEQRRLAEALSNTAAVLSSTLDLDEVLDRLLAQVASVMPATIVDIMLIDEGFAHVVRTRGYVERGLTEYAKHIRFNVSEVANLRQMIETGKPIRIPDTHTDPGWLYDEQLAWIRSNIGAPIELEGETIGFLNISSETSDAFTTTQAQQLQAFADQAAIAIRNARLYKAARHHAGVLEGLVKERTAQLEFANQSLKVMFDATGEGIIFTEDEQIVYTNPAMTSLTGYDQAELVGVAAAVLRDGSANDGQGAPLLAPLLRDRLWRGDMPLRRKDGSRFHAGLTISRVDAPDAVGTRAVTLIRDISREKALQEQKSNFVAFASHELRTPITNLKTRLYLLRKRPEFLDDHLVVLDHVAEWMQKLVEDLLDITRLERSQVALEFRDTPVQELIKRVVVLQTPEAERKSIALLADIPDEPIVVCLDRERIVQVITNLTTNAISYTPEGGSVTITALPEPDGAVIQVRDTGIGIAAKHLPHIFEPFYRVISSVEGTGLGLPIARQIVDLHGGRLEVQSETGRGTCFSIHLLKLPETQFRV